MAGRLSLLRYFRLLVTVVVLGVLAAGVFQLWVAQKVAQHEFERVQAEIQGELHLWAVSEAQKFALVAKAVGLFKAPIAEAEEAGRTSTLSALLYQIRNQFHLKGVVFAGEDGQLYTPEGVQPLAHLPAVLVDLPAQRALFYLINDGFAQQPWQQVFERPGLYQLLRIPVHYDIGDEAGNLYLIRELLHHGGHATYLQGLLHSQRVTFYLRPLAEVVSRHGEPVWKQVFEDGTLRLWLPTPAYVFGHGESGFVVERSVGLLQQTMQLALVAILVPLVVFLLLMAALGRVLWLKVVHPLQQAAETVEGVRAGSRREVALLPGAVEEVATVVEQTNALLDKVRGKQNALKAVNAELEQRVKKRTLALERAHRDLRKRALEDPLTHLPNRLALEERWPDISTHHDEAGIAIVDIDFFHEINETYGGEVGNRVLVHVAETLDRLRQKGATIYRLSGDEFAIVATAMTPQQFEHCLAKFLAVLQDTPPETLGMTAHLSLSIGWSWLDLRVPVPLSDALKQADLAMRAAKHTLDRKVQRYQPEVHGNQSPLDYADAQAVAQMVRDGTGLELVAQPVVRTSDERVDYCEILARMAIDGRTISPGVFLPLVERLHLQAAFDQRVIEQMTARIQAHPCNRGFSINLSAEALQHPDLKTWLSDLAAYTADHKIVLEVTETTLVQDLSAAQATLGELRAMGFKVAIDDFGSGYSSISYLAHLSADIIKFDRALVLAAHDDKRSAALIVGLARSLRELGYDVVFEGIEDAAMCRHFADVATHVQGFVYARPMPLDEAATFEPAPCCNQGCDEASPLM